METTKNSIERVGLKVGLLTLLALIAYFFLMKALGLAHIFELRFFNFIILALGICYGIQKLKEALNEKDFYLKGLSEGMFISFVAVTLFGVFIGFYLEYFDVKLLEDIKLNSTMGNYMNGLTIFIVITSEGIASGVIITLIAMQYYKVSGEKKVE